MTFIVIAKWIAAAGEEAAVEETLKRMAEATKREPGCLEYRIHKSNDDPQLFLLYEEYTGREAYEFHLTSPHFQEHGLREGIPRLDRREREFYSLVARSGAESS
jgi:quinol monooxygenase YgiN